MDIQEGTSVSRSDVQSKKNLLNKAHHDVNKEILANLRMNVFLILDDKIKLVEKSNQKRSDQRRN